MKTATPKPAKIPGLFAEYEPHGMEMHHLGPMSRPGSAGNTERMRDFGRLVETMKNFREAAKRDDESVFACIAAGIWTLTNEQARTVAEFIADLIAGELHVRGHLKNNTDRGVTI